MRDGAGPTVARLVPIERKPADDRVTWLVDNAEAYREVLRAIARARRSIWIAQLAFDADCVAYDDAATYDQTAVGSPLLQALIDASTRVPVRIVLNQSLLLDTATPLRMAVRRVGATDVRIRGIKRFPQLLHAKMVVIDEREALLLGSPFVNGYWDHADHPPTDARRGDRELGGRPLHDVSMAITGPAVHSLSAIFAELWNDLSVGDADDAALECRPADARGSDGIRIARTAPAGAPHSHDAGRTDILAAIEGALARARRLVYVEHQYLSSRRVIAALAEALTREDSLEVVIVLNQNPDVTAYRSWQNARLRESGLLSHPRVGLFALWRAKSSTTDDYEWVVNQLFVHSKVLIVDDAWLTMGSANLDGVSLHSYGDDFTGWLGRRIFRDVRNFDVNVVMTSETHGRADAIRTLCTRLWTEHLGVPASALDTPPAGGWLALWRSRAAEGVAVLDGPRTDDVERCLALPLPYSTMPTPRLQLRDIGVRATERLDLRFDPGWLEVHFSPNWVRNMFA
ncbi:MAG TPA: phospholipase D-like domain-containing protein [Gemmatimonadaceae bacterium]